MLWERSVHWEAAGVDGLGWEGGSCGNKVQVVAAIVVEPSIFISLRSTSPDLPNSPDCDVIHVPF